VGSQAAKMRLAKRKERMGFLKNARARRSEA